LLLGWLGLRIRRIRAQGNPASDGGAESRRMGGVRRKRSTTEREAPHPTAFTA
jgi:hypothetical protein